VPFLKRGDDGSGRFLLEMEGLGSIRAMEEEDRRVEADGHDDGGFGRCSAGNGENRERERE
jgi:hypothetical protein